MPDWQFTPTVSPAFPNTLKQFKVIFMASTDPSLSYIDGRCFFDPNLFEETKFLQKHWRTIRDEALEITKSEVLTQKPNPHNEWLGTANFDEIVDEAKERENGKHLLAYM